MLERTAAMKAATAFGHLRQHDCSPTAPQDPVDDPSKAASQRPGLAMLAAQCSARWEKRTEDAAAAELRDALMELDAMMGLDSQEGPAPVQASAGTAELPPAYVTPQGTGGQLQLQGAPAQCRREDHSNAPGATPRVVSPPQGGFVRGERVGGGRGGAGAGGG